MTETYAAGNQELKLHEGGVLYRDLLGVEHHLGWQGLQGVKKSVFSGRLAIRGREGSVPLHFLSPEKQSALLRQFYEMWRTRDAAAAKKNAFDFVDHQRGFAWIMLFMSMFFFLPLGTVMLQDSIGQWRCNQLLRQESAWTNAEVTKTKKKRKGHYILTLKFSAGPQVVEAMDQFFTEEANDTPPASIPVLYAPAKPTCWILAKSDGATAHWEKRKFFSAYLSMFGIVLFLVGLAGFIWTIFRFKEKNPHVEAIREMFQFR